MGIRRTVSVHPKHLKPKPTPKEWFHVWAMSPENAERSLHAEFTNRPAADKHAKALKRQGYRDILIVISDHSDLYGK